MGDGCRQGSLALHLHSSALFAAIKVPSEHASQEGRLARAICFPCGLAPPPGPTFILALLGAGCLPGWPGPSAHTDFVTLTPATVPQ